MTPDRQATIDGLREFADWLEAHPEAQTPVSCMAYDYRAEKVDLLAALADFGGRWDKQASDDDPYFDLVRHFGPITYKLFTGRENVCERRVTGTRKVMREVAVDPEREAALRDELDALPTEKQTVTEDVVIWLCPDSLLAEAEEVEG